MPDLKPYIVLGLAVGGVFSLSGVGIVVLYRATAVLNLAYGAIGAVGALLAYSLTTGVGLSMWLSVAIVVVFCGMLSLVYGTFFGVSGAAESVNGNDGRGMPADCAMACMTCCVSTPCTIPTSIVRDGS